MNEDLVRRKAVLNTLNRMDKALDTDRTVETYRELLEECFKVLPTVDAVPIKDIEQVLSDIDTDKRNNSTELWYKDMCCDSDSGCAFEGMEFLLNVLKRYWRNNHE